MTILDKLCRLSGTTDPTSPPGVPQDLGGVTTAGVLSTNWFDLGETGLSLGEGYPLTMLVTVHTEAIDVSGDPDATLEIQCIASPRTTLAAFTFADADVSAAGDTITEAAHGLTDGTLVVLTTTGVVPAGLALLTHYFVVGATTDTFQLSLTPGGSAVNITAAAGGGTHTVTWYPTTLGRTEALPLNRLLAGDQIQLPIGYQLGSKQPPFHRYIFARFLPSATLSTGMVFADIIAGRQDQRIFGASGFSLQI